MRRSRPGSEAWISPGYSTLKYFKSVLLLKVRFCQNIEYLGKVVTFKSKTLYLAPQLCKVTVAVLDSCN
jgi:hypothetical protein